MNSRRTERLGSQMVREVSDIILRKISDPRLQWVTITRATVTADLREAKIYISTLQNDEASRTRTLEGIRHAAGFIRGELGRRLELRLIPELHFFFDEEIEKSERVLKIISQIESERGSGEHGTGA